MILRTVVLSAGDASNKGKGKGKDGKAKGKGKDKGEAKEVREMRPPAKVSYSADRFKV